MSSLDAAGSRSFDAATADQDLRAAVRRMLEGSLFERQADDEVSEGVVLARAEDIWSRPGSPRGEATTRRGWLGGWPLLDANLPELVARLVEAEIALDYGDINALAVAGVAFAELAFQTARFVRGNWVRVGGKRYRHGCRVVVCRCTPYVRGGRLGCVAGGLGVSASVGDGGRRVHAMAVAFPRAESLAGVAALAVEVGSANQSEIILLKSGLGSRDAARLAVTTTSADFADREGMLDWLASGRVESWTRLEGWPSELRRAAGCDSTTLQDR